MIKIINTNNEEVFLKKENIQAMVCKKCNNNSYTEIHLQNGDIINSEIKPEIVLKTPDTEFWLNKKFEVAKEMAAALLIRNTDKEDNRHYVSLSNKVGVAIDLADDFITKFRDSMDSIFIRQYGVFPVDYRIVDDERGEIK